MEKLTDREVREKLVSRGVQSLSDRELLSIILGEGSAGYSAVETAGRILDAYDGSLPGHGPGRHDAPAHDRRHRR